MDDGSLRKQVKHAGDVDCLDFWVGFGKISQRIGQVMML